MRLRCTQIREFISCMHNPCVEYCFSAYDDTSGHRSLLVDLKFSVDLGRCPVFDIGQEYELSEILGKWVD